MPEKGSKNIDIIRADIEQRLSRDFPALYRDELCIIDSNNNRLVIDDISYKADTSIEESLELLFLSCSGDVQSFDARRQAQLLGEGMERLVTVLDPKRTMVLFPGNGAQVVQDLLPTALFADMQVLSVPTVRTIDPKTKAVQGVSIANVTKMRKIVGDKKIRNVVVVDDVIMSGTTLSAIRQALSIRNADWYAGSFFMLSPIQNKGRATTPSGVDGYKVIITPTLYQGTTGIPAVNSLSTLIGSSEKSEAVRKRYMTDFVEDSALFSEMVELLQQTESLKQGERI